MQFWGMAKWPPIGGWMLLMRVAAYSRFYCTEQNFPCIIGLHVNSLNHFNWEGNECLYIKICKC